MDSWAQCGLYVATTYSIRDTSKPLACGAWAFLSRFLLRAECVAKHGFLLGHCSSVPTSMYTAKWRRCIGSSSFWNATTTVLNSENQRLLSTFKLYIHILHCQVWHTQVTETSNLHKSVRKRNKFLKLCKALFWSLQRLWALSFFSTTPISLAQNLSCADL